MALKIRDDISVLGEAGFSRTWNDDAVEVYFASDPLTSGDKYESNDGQVRISSHDGQTASLEGAVAIFGTPTQLPFLWDVLGVRAAFLREGEVTSYEVELPSQVLGRPWLPSGVTIGLNVKVTDDDDGGGLDHVLSWMPDEKSNSWIATDGFAEVQFSGNVSSVDEGEAQMTEARATEVAIAEKAIGALRSYQDGRLSQAYTEFSEIRAEGTVAEQALSIFVLAEIAEARGHSDKKAELLEDLIQLRLGPGWSSWRASYALWELGWAYVDMGEPSRARSTFTEGRDVVAGILGSGVLLPQSTLLLLAGRGRKHQRSRSLFK